MAWGLLMHVALLKRALSHALGECILQGSIAIDFVPFKFPLNVAMGSPEAVIICYDDLNELAMGFGR